MITLALVDVSCSKKCSSPSDTPLPVDLFSDHNAYVALYKKK